MQGLNIEKLIEKLDDKKIEELAKIIDQLPTLNETLKLISQLKESDILDILIEFSYLLKLIRDMLTDDSVKNFAETLGGLTDLSQVLSQNSDKIKEVIRNLDTINYLINTVNQLKADGTLDAIINVAYFLKEIKDMLSDEAISNLALILALASDFLSGGTEFLNCVLSPSICNIIKSLTSPEAQKMLSNPPKVSLGTLLTSLRDEDVQRGMGILITILKILGKNYK